MAVKLYISLEGDDIILQKFAKIRQVGEDMGNRLQQAVGGITGVPPDVTVNIDNATKAVGEHTTSVSNLRQAYYTLAPLLREAGVTMTGMRGWSMLARVGIEGLAIAITTGLLVALSKISDAANKAQTQLGDLLQGKQLGSSTFAAMQADAEHLGTTIANLAPAFNSWVIAWQKFVETNRNFKFVAPPGMDLPPDVSGSVEKLRKAYVALYEALRIGKATNQEASAALNTFGNEMQRTGQVTGTMLEQLRLVAPAAFNAIMDAFGKTEPAEQWIKEVDKIPISMRKFIDVMVLAKPKIDETFDSGVFKSFQDGLDQIISALNDELLQATGLNFSENLVREFDGITKGIHDASEEIRMFYEWYQKLRNRNTIENLPAPAQGNIANRFANVFLPSEESAKAMLRDMGMTEDEVVKAFNKISNSGEQSADKTDISWSTAADKIKIAFETTGEAVTLTFDQIAQKAQSAAQKAQQNPFFAPSPPPKWVGPTGTIESPTAPTAMLTPSAPAQQTTQTLVAPFQEADNQIREIWLALSQWISESLGEVNLSALTQALVSPFAAAVPLIRDELAKVEEMILRLMEEAASAYRLIQGLNQGGRPSGGGQGWVEVAEGGYIRGPGSTTSDSILAWLSNKEFVVNARAVSHYGADFFSALNAMRLPKDLFGHFAVGGLANALARTLPRFQSGGLATASVRSLTIVLDGQRFGLNGSADVVDQFERVATRVGIAQIGRPPGWVR